MIKFPSYKVAAGPSFTQRRLTDEEKTAIQQKRQENKKLREGTKRPMVRVDGVRQIVKKHNEKKLPRQIDKAIEKVRGKSSREILELSGIETVKYLSEADVMGITGRKRLPQGVKILSSYSQPSSMYTYSDIGIDDNKLLEGVIATTGDFNLRGSTVKKTEVKYIGGELIVGDCSNIEDLSSIERVGDSVIIEAANEKEALKMLKALNFHPKHVGRQLIVLPPDKPRRKNGKKLDVKA